MPDERTTWTLTLDDAGFPGLWVVFDAPEIEATQELMALHRDQDSLPSGWAMPAVFELLARSVVDWNVPQVKTGQIIKLTDDQAANASAFAGIPTDVYAAILVVYNERMNAERTRGERHA